LREQDAQNGSDKRNQKDPPPRCWSLKPIGDHLPSRSRIEINPSTQSTITSFGTMWKTLCPITTKAPKQNSNALNGRDARGLPEGNGTVGENNKQDSLFMLCLMRSCSRGR